MKTKRRGGGAGVCDVPTDHDVASNTTARGDDAAIELVPDERLEQPRPPDIGTVGLTSVHVNLPTVLWRAASAMAEALGMTRTNLLVRALNREAYFARLLLEDPDARVYVQHSDGSRERVAFI
jgi:hypothetical protein